MDHEVSEAIHRPSCSNLTEQKHIARVQDRNGTPLKLLVWLSVLWVVYVVHLSQVLELLLVVQAVYRGTPKKWVCVQFSYTRNWKGQKELKKYVSSITKSLNVMKVLHFLSSKANVLRVNIDYITASYPKWTPSLTNDFLFVSSALAILHSLLSVLASIVLPGLTSTTLVRKEWCV